MTSISSTGRALGLGCALLVWLLASPAHAQRGGSFARQDAYPREPNSGFPELFDTEVAGAGNVTGGLPTLSLDVGITDDLSVGVNVLSALMPIAKTSGGLVGTVRYRIHSSPTVRSVVTLVGGGMTGDAWGYVGAFVSSTRFVVEPQHHLTVHLAYANYDAQLPGDEGHAGSLGGAGVTYTVIPAEWVALHVMVAPVTFATLTERVGPQSTITDHTAPERFYERVAYRATASFRWDELVLFEVGVAGAGERVIPWINLAFRSNS